MNDPLKDLTPELIEELEASLLTEDDAHVAYLVTKNQEIILSSMRAAIAYRREMDTMIRGRDEG